MMAISLPKDNAADSEFEDNTSWRYNFGLSFIWVAIGMFGFLLVIRNDTPKYYLTNGDEPNAIASIKKIYNTRDSDAQA